MYGVWVDKLVSYVWYAELGVGIGIGIETEIIPLYSDHHCRLPEMEFKLGTQFTELGFNCKSSSVNSLRDE